MTDTPKRRHLYTVINSARCVPAGLIDAVDDVWVGLTLTPGGKVIRTSVFFAESLAKNWQRESRRAESMRVNGLRRRRQLG